MSVEVAPGNNLAVPGMQLARQRIDELDGLRGLLALFVVMYHLCYPLESFRVATSIWFPLLGAGAWYAVDVFFVMSGFVMCHVYGNNFVGSVQSSEFWKFMHVRVARLYPVHLVVLFLLLVGFAPFIIRSPEMVAAGSRYGWDAFAASLIMLHSPWIEQRTWNYPAWSISAEWHAYVLYPFLMIQFHQMRRALVWLLLFLGVAIPFAIYRVELQPDQFPTNGLVVLLRVLPLFICGMALYKLRDVSLWRPIALGVVVLTLLFLCFKVTAPYAVLLIPALLQTVLHDDWVGRIFRCKQLVWLGKISYSLYMTHALVDIFLMRILVKTGNLIFGATWTADIGNATFLWLFCIAAAVLLGYLTWRYIEVPGRRWIMRS